MTAVVRAIKMHKDLAILANLRQQLDQHPVFESLVSPADLCGFMRAHVFAVWDFMSLLKRLQRDLTCVDVPWLPRRDPVAAHLINEIVLGEESDIAPNGQPSSHMDIYLDAMQEVGADTTQFRRFLQLIANGVDPLDAMRAVGAPDYVCAFVRHTLHIAAQEPTLTVMASFFHGRENVIPRMFSALLRNWQIAEDRAPMFVFYLKRHIQVDGDTHGPMAQRIIERATADDPVGQELVLHAAIESVRARIALWDGLQLSLLQARAA